jgi:asparaginyl-tRNA synthetase
LEKSGKKFEFPVAWGLDLQKEHEKYLVEVRFLPAFLLRPPLVSLAHRASQFEFDNRPVFVTHYPKDIKPFYMKLDEVAQPYHVCVVCPWVCVCPCVSCVSCVSCG